MPSCAENFEPGAPDAAAIAAAGRFMAARGVHGLAWLDAHLVDGRTHWGDGSSFDFANRVLERYADHALTIAFGRLMGTDPERLLPSIVMWVD